MKLKDLTGKRFGRLKVLRREGTYTTPSGASSPTWRCRCDCGKEVVIVGGSLRNGMTKSCGCHRWKENAYKIVDGVVYVDLDGVTAKVDEQDLPIITRERWYINKHNGYIYGSTTNELLHRALINPSKTMVVDHINGDRSDNRRANLREVTYSINGINRKIVPGKSGEPFISYSKSSHYYSVIIDGEYRGGSTSLGEAVKIRDREIMASKVALFNYDYQQNYKK